MQSRILLVEENEEMASAVRAALGRAGLRCEHAADTTQGMAMFRAREPHMVLLSLGLPTLGGIVLCPQIRAASTLPISILSVRTRREDQLHALKLGADDFVFLRQFDEQVLVARVLTLLRRVYIYGSGSTAASAAAPVATSLPSQAPAGWVTCDSCAYMGPAYRFEKLNAAGQKSIVCPHCALADSVRFELG